MVLSLEDRKLSQFDEEPTPRARSQIDSLPCRCRLRSGMASLRLKNRGRSFGRDHRRLGQLICSRYRGELGCYLRLLLGAEGLFLGLHQSTKNLRVPTRAIGEPGHDFQKSLGRHGGLRQRGGAGDGIHEYRNSVADGGIFHFQAVRMVTQDARTADDDRLAQVPRLDGRRKIFQPHEAIDSAGHRHPKGSIKLAQVSGPVVNGERIQG